MVPSWGRDNGNVTMFRRVDGCHSPNRQARSQEKFDKMEPLKSEERTRVLTTVRLL